MSSMSLKDLVRHASCWSLVSARHDLNGEMTTLNNNTLLSYLSSAADSRMGKLVPAVLSRGLTTARN
jgi:hypothetical protein